MALALGLLGGLLGLLVASVATAALVPLYGAAIVIALGWSIQVTWGRGLPYPRRSWQVPESWRQTMPPLFTSSSYGFLLGLGFLTDVVLPVYWVLVAATLVVGDPVTALGAWLLYGIGRALLTQRQSAVFVSAAEGGGQQPMEPAMNARRFLGVARALTVAVLLAAAVGLANELIGLSTGT